MNTTTKSNQRPEKPAGPPARIEETIVIGTGFGGAVAACRLAQAGIPVLVIERGRRYERQDFPALPDNSNLLPDLSRWTWQHSQGLWDIVDLEEMISVQAAGFGGGSLIYANVHLRPPKVVFDDHWPNEYRGRSSLDEYFDLAAFMLGAAPIDTHPKLANQVIKADQLRQAARHLHRENAFFHPPLAVSSKAGANPHGRQQEACTGCGACCTGCPEGAKNTLDFNYLAIAEARGARVATQCEVVDIEQAASGEWILTCIDHLTAETCRYHAKNVFLCAGAVHSSRLLARAKLKSNGRQAQSLVGIGYYPNADAMGMVYDTAHPQHPSFGPTITTSTVCWGSNDPAAFFLVQDGGYARALDRLLGVLQAPVWVGRNRLTRSAAQAATPASDIAPPRYPAEAPHGPRLISPLDDVIAAVRSGTFMKVPSDTLRADVSRFLKEVQDLCLIPQIVDRTIDKSLHDWLKRSWLTSWLDPAGWPARQIVRFQKWLVRQVYGSSEDLATRAFGAMLHGGDLSAADLANRVLGYGAEGADHRLMLLGMGRDARPGVLHYDAERDRMVADLDLYHLAPRYSDEERVMADIAGALGGELRTNPAWAFLGKPISVHNQGGCPMSRDPRFGVTTPEGQVHGCPGLYVLDGSVLCTSVGVNPSATITAIAERNILLFIQDYLSKPEWPAGDAGVGAREYHRQVREATAWSARARNDRWVLEPPACPPQEPKSQPLGLGFSEVMEGYYYPTDHAPADENEYRDLETTGRPSYPATLTLDISVENLASFFEDCQHEMKVEGRVKIRLPQESAERDYPVSGRLELFVARHKPYGIDASQVGRRAAQMALNQGRYTTVKGAPARGEQRRMNYSLSFVDGRRAEWRIEGYKLIRNDPGLDAWRDTSTLFIQLLGPGADASGANGHGANGHGANGHGANGHGAAGLAIRGAGAVHVDLTGFLYRQLPSLHVTPPGTDSSRAVWATLKFASFFFGSLQRIYAPEVGRTLEALFKPLANNVRQTPPPVSN